MPLRLQTDAFEDGGIVPFRHSCFGENVQPGFKFLALNLPETAGRTELLSAMEGKVLDKAAYVGRFKRKG